MSPRDPERACSSLIRTSSRPAALRGTKSDCTTPGDRIKAGLTVPGAPTDAERINLRGERDYATLLIAVRVRTLSAGAFLPAAGPVPS
ncbi:hypothetical protein OJAV_G00085470 [Oryzias javanicus]|uniref:Uncharacterized protein n=1 Tax=Oryzias javanicus TaxID=123683 RepID=A0A3S2PIT2_ORYJA|nr:hypothetical protein OJAV_G00085470 [Oryzias javanicus]